MSYLIVFSTFTGNTGILAEAIKDVLVEFPCAYYGEIEGSENFDADILFVGFCVHEGTCTDEVKHYLESLKDQRIALFGTAGSGGSKSYCETILEEVKSYIPISNNVIGGFMCQGKMTENVLERYQNILEEKPGDIETLEMMSNYYSALSHPDENDINNVQIFAKKVFRYFNE